MWELDWVNSRSWWWTGKPGMLQSIGSQRVGHDWATELNSTEASFNFTAAVTVHSDFGDQENKICHCFNFFPFYLHDLLKTSPELVTTVTFRLWGEARGCKSMHRKCLVSLGTPPVVPAFHPDPVYHWIPIRQNSLPAPLSMKCLLSIFFSPCSRFKSGKSSSNFSGIRLLKFYFNVTDG